MSGEINRRSFLKSVGALAAAATLATSSVAGIGSASAQDASRIRKLGVLTQPQASVPEEFESIQLAASQITQLGIELDIQAMPYDQLSDIVWFDRPTWDLTAWQMVGRPERLDPDEFIYNLFHSSTAEDGYNFVGYINPEYDALAEAQRSEVDLEKRQAIVLETQKVVARDQPYTFFVYPAANYAFNKTIFDESTVVDAKGIGIKNYWTFVGATPLGDQKDMILNTLVSIQAINPLYISGGTDSWITELIWDRLMRVGADGLPTPSAATSIEWVDNLTCNVTLRDGLTWHDGQPVTTDDVVFPVIMAKLHAARETAGERLRALVASNVKMTAGTDSMHGLFPFELQTLVHWGMSPVDALRAGTIRAAECCRVEAEVGTLEPGKRADLITVAANPLEDIANIERMRIVVKNGIRQDRLLWAPPA